MIKLVHVHLEKPLELTSDWVTTLVIESPAEFYRTVCELSRQAEGGDGDFIFYLDGKEISPSLRGEMIRDVFSIDFKDKKIIGLLHKRLEKICVERMPEKLCSLQKACAEFFEELFFDFSFPLSHEEIEPPSIFKAASVSPVEEYDSLSEKLISYINLLVALKQIDFLIFVNLKGMLSEVDLQKLFEHCQREKVSLFLVENTLLRKFAAAEKITLITEDLCEIEVKPENLM